jgi:anti-sigma28 factor (negative regulator of flagellin synthesis)
MSEINSIGHGGMEPLDRAAGTAAYHTAQRLPLNGHKRGAGDTVELSTQARLLERILQLPDVRMDLVQRVRHAIAEGSYETEEKLGTAVERLLEEIG